MLYRRGSLTIEYGRRKSWPLKERNMELIKTKNKSRYRAKVYLHGRAITKTFERKADAEKWKRQKLDERERIEIFNEPVIKDITLSKFAEIWILNKQDLAKRTHDSYRSILKNYLIPELGNRNLRQIRIHDAQLIILSMQKKNLSVARINAFIIFFKQILSDAIKWEYLLNHPLKNLTRLKAPPQSESYWLPDEISAFLNSNRSSPHYALFVTALNTGMRRGELLGLKWDKVDFENKKIEVSRIRDRYGIKNTTKTGKIVFIPMNDVVYRTLQNLKNESRDDKLVFVHKDGREIDLEHVSNRIFKNACELAQVKKIKFHNLRSTFAANFCMKGGNIYDLSKILNHSSVDMTSRKYAHLHPDYLYKAISKVAFEAFSS